MDTWIAQPAKIKAGGFPGGTTPVTPEHGRT